MHTVFTAPADEMLALVDSSCTESAASGDPWSQTLRLLDMLRAGIHGEPPPASGNKPTEVAAEPAYPHRMAQSRRWRCPQAEAGVAVTVLERLTTTSVVLRWRSPSCHYGDQVWTCCVARTGGICAVTGQPIQRGEPVYRLQNRRRMPPVNAGAMIHPSALA
jgi:hypothetical protein